MIHDICIFFGCGKTLSPVEKLCGNKCLKHQNDIETVNSINRNNMNLYNELQRTLQLNRSVSFLPSKVADIRIVVHDNNYDLRSVVDIETKNMREPGDAVAFSIAELNNKISKTIKQNEA